MFLESTKGRTKQTKKHVPCNEQKVPAGPQFGGGGGGGGEYENTAFL